MKPTDKQKIICDIIIEQAKFWQTTNDINSPTHICDIEQSISLFNELDDITKAELEEQLVTLYYIVKLIDS